MQQHFGFIHVASNFLATNSCRCPSFDFYLLVIVIGYKELFSSRLTLQKADQNLCCRGFQAYSWLYFKWKAKHVGDYMVNIGDMAFYVAGILIIWKIKLLVQTRLFFLAGDLQALLMLTNTIFHVPCWLTNLFIYQKFTSFSPPVFFPFLTITSARLAVQDECLTFAIRIGLQVQSGPKLEKGQRGHLPPHVFLIF